MIVREITVQRRAVRFKEVTCLGFIQIFSPICDEELLGVTCQHAAVHGVFIFSCSPDFTVPLRSMYDMEHVTRWLFYSSGHKWSENWLILTGSTWTAVFSVLHLGAVFVVLRCNKTSVLSVAVSFYGITLLTNRAKNCFIKALLCWQTIRVLSRTAHGSCTAVFVCVVYLCRVLYYNVHGYAVLYSQIEF